MNEDEAKQTICPLMSFSAFNVSEVMCRASKCMMWRWETAYHYYPHDQVDPDQVILRVEGKETEHGYCGLGGKP